MAATGRQDGQPDRAARLGCARNVARQDGRCRGVAQRRERNRERGDCDQAPVVLVHGFAQSARTWDEVAPLIVAAGKRPVAVDLAGHGLAARPGEAAAYGIGAQADRLLETMRAVGGGAPVPVVGYSMGGRVALVAAERDPAAFAGIALESAGLGPADAEARMRLEERNRAWARRVREEGVEAFMAWWESLPLFATQRDLPAEARAALRAERMANDAEALARTLEQAGAHAMPPASCAIEALRGLAEAGRPVAYVAGARDEKYAAVAGRVREALAAHPRASVRIVEGAGHNVHLERPAAFVRALEPILS